jgi:hypothetical protein
MPSFQAHMGNYDSNDPADQTRKGWLTSILELGAWLGTLLIATAVFIVGVVVQATAITAGHNAILGGRFIT